MFSLGASEKCSKRNSQADMTILCRVSSLLCYYFFFVSLLLSLSLSFIHSFFLSFFFHYKERLRYKVEIEHYFWKNKGLIVQFLNNRGYTHSLGAYFLSRVFGDGKRCWNHGQHSYALVRFLTYSFRIVSLKIISTSLKASWAVREY